MPQKFDQQATRRLVGTATVCSLDGNGHDGVGLHFSKTKPG
jgi:hypothetical protein